MRLFYECEICESQYSTENEALACEARGDKPTYSIGEKVMFKGYIGRISDRFIHKGLHSYSYRVHIHQEDNQQPVWVIFPGWYGEEEFTPIAKAA